MEDRNNKASLAKYGILSYVKMDIIHLWIKIIIACVPAAVVGLAFDDKFEAAFYNYQTVAIALIVFVLLLLLLRISIKEKEAG